MKFFIRLLAFCCCISIYLSCLVQAHAETINPNKILNANTENAQKLNEILTPSEKVWLKNNASFKVAVKSNWMPIEFKLENGEHRGISVDYLAALSNLLNISFVIVDYADNMDAKDADIISGVSNLNLKNTQFKLLAKPYLEFPLAIYTDKRLEKKPNKWSLEMLNGARVAVYKNGIIGQQIHEKYPEIKLVYVDVADEAFEKLEADVIEAYIGNEIIIDYHIMFNRINFAEKSGLTPFTATVSMAASTDKPELASILEKGLLTVEPNNKKIQEKWIVKDAKNNLVAFIVLAILAVMFFIGLYRFYRLKQTIKRTEFESQQKIWYQANYDFLTKLPNRHFLHNHLEQALSGANKSNLLVGLLYIDLDHFKSVNDHSGHNVGDKVLAETAERIKSCVRSSDITGRIGGDEFMVVMEELKDSQHLENICEKILIALERPFFVDSHVFYISSSIGVTVYPQDSLSAKELLVFADQAMYEAKKLGRNRYQFFKQSMQTASSYKLSIAQDLRSAINTDQFIVHYQPILNLCDSTITKAEALIRWNHPKKGLISPADFIPIAEESGLIDALGQWVFNQALKDLMIIRQQLGVDFQLSINVSPYQFHYPERLLEWVKSIKESGVPGNCICIEITEGLLLDASNTVLSTLSALREVGIELSIDDFGTGYSALAYLKKFDVNYVKIDKSFIQNLAVDNYDAVLCEAIINMAKKLGIKIIAEGIETNLQKALLNEFECDYGQGYLFAKPNTIHTLLALIEASKRNGQLK